MTPDDLRKIAEKMGPVEWDAIEDMVYPVASGCTCFGGDPVLGHEPLCGLGGAIAQADPYVAEFIATFNPARVLELLARLAAVEKLHKREEIDYCDDPECCDLTPTCTECIGLWPCPTIKAIKGETND